MEIFIAFLSVFMIVSLIGFIRSEQDYRLYRSLVQLFETLSEEEKFQFTQLRIAYILNGSTKRQADKILLSAMKDYISKKGVKDESVSVQ